MAHNNARQASAMPSGELDHHLRDLKLAFIAEHYGDLANQAAGKQWSHVDYLGRLIEGEAHVRRDRATHNRLRQARFPVIKTLDQFRWDWPAQSHEQGKTHLATALGYTACLQGHSVLFASAIDVINTLAAAKSAGRLKQELKKYTKPALLILDELGYLPIDKSGADLLFQVISVRYEQGSIMLTSNRAFKEWPKMFNNDSTLTSAILDRLLHHAEIVVIEGKSFRMRGQIES